MCRDGHFHASDSRSVIAEVLARPKLATEVVADNALWSLGRDADDDLDSMLGKDVLGSLPHAPSNDNRYPLLVQPTRQHAPAREPAGRARES